MKTIFNEIKTFSKPWIKKTSKFVWSKIKGTFFLLWSKGVVFGAAALLMLQFIAIPDENPVPFLEMLYGLIKVLLIFATAAVGRFLFFSKVSEDAESGRLDEEISIGKFTPAIAQYWFATAITLIIAALCLK
tara:strand:+ start:4551 stop:4946 length:396 start_codon:yes stop_codon:yes gene_type:complete